MLLELKITEMFSKNLLTIDLELDLNNKWIGVMIIVTRVLVVLDL